MATICDQGTTNQSAIETLVKDARAAYLRNGENPKRRIVVGEQEIIPLYDVPHLIKGVRNNLLDKDLVWRTEGKEVVAKWEDIVCAYHIDAASGDIRALPKLTDFHVLPEKIRKMKVANVTQVFSHSVAATIAIMARNSKYVFLLHSSVRRLLLGLQFCFGTCCPRCTNFRYYTF